MARRDGGGSASVSSAASIAIRARGVYFALITFGARRRSSSKVVYNTRAIGGSDGILGIPVLDIDPRRRARSRARQPAVFFLRRCSPSSCCSTSCSRLPPRHAVRPRADAASAPTTDRVPYLGYRPVLLQAPGLRAGGADRGASAGCSIRCCAASSSPRAARSSRSRATP